MNDLLKQIIQNGKLATGVWETVYLTLLSTFIAYIIGLPLGIILYSTDKNGLKPVVWLNKVLGFIVNILRSIPFIILMVSMIPVSRLIVGTGIGNKAMIVMLVIAAAPYVARMVESSLKEIDGGVIEAAKSMGASDFQIITRVFLPETKPSLIVGAVISTVTVLGYSAMAATIGAGGLGALAINYGHLRGNNSVIWVCVAFIVIIVQIIQELGMFIARKIDKRIRNKK
ncbi:MAG TPA: methionine ABC transporter permease [Clostridiales bacterium]|nr:methionine ABC transporter permease [Clostridiales bacterium]